MDREESRKRPLDWSLLSPTPVEDDAELSLEERRRRNMERNRVFMEMNFGSTLLHMASPVTPQLAAAPTSTNKSSIDVIAERRAIMKELLAKHPHRSEQVTAVFRYFSAPPIAGRAALYVYGPPETFKHAVLAGVLSALSIVAIEPDCRHVGPRYILAALWAATLHALGVGSSSDALRCPRSVAAYVQALPRLLKSIPSTRRVCIVISQLHALQLSSHEAHHLSTLGRHVHSTQLSVCIVSTSIPSELLRPQCVCVYFPSLPQTAVAAILLQSEPQDDPSSRLATADPSDPSIGGGGLQLAAIAREVSTRATLYSHSLRELRGICRHIAHLQVAKGAPITVADVQGFIARMLTLKSPALCSLKDDRAAERDKRCAVIKPNPALDALPLRTKCMLLAAYLSMMNPMTSDSSTMLGEGQGRRKKGSDQDNEDAGAAVVADGVQEKAGPVFAAERLLSIYAMVYLKVTGHSLRAYQDVHSQALVANLVRRRLLFTAPGNHFRLLSPKYGCRLSHAQAEALAKSVGLQIGSYLVNSNVSSYSFR